MTFFYNLNKRLDGIRATPETTHGQLNERDEGKPGKMFAKISADAAKKYGSKEAGDRVAGKIRADKAKAGTLEEQTVEEGIYQGGPDKSQIPAVNRPGNKLTTADLEKERTQSPTSAEGMRALQDKLSKINPMDEVGDTPAGLAAVQKVGQRADRALGDAGTGYSGSELANPDKTYAARDRANSIAGRERIRANDKNPTRVFGGPNHSKQMEEGLPMVKGPNGKMVPKFAADGKGKNDLQGKKPAQATESIKLVAVKEGAGQTAKVYCDTAYNEFHVRVFNQGQEVVKSRYFTQNQADAIAAANYMVEGVFTMAPKQKTTEAAKWRDPKYKDKLYTQEPRDYDQYDYGDDDYYNPKPADYPGEKNLKGGGEFDHNDPLQKGQGIGRSGIKHSILDRGPRKGLPSRDQITSLKGSIKSARGTHARPNLPEAAGSVNFDKVLDAIAALYGDDMWHNDSMQDVAHDLEQQNPTDQELDFIIAKGRLPKRLANTQFSAGDGVQFGEASAPMTAKQKSFAALAEPRDKITFADKIAGAKKEVDEMLGDVAAEAMKKALGGGMGRSAEMEEKEDLNPFTNYKNPRADRPKVGSTEHGALHDITHGTTDPRYSGRMVTRRVDPNTGHSVGADDDTPGEKRGRGRPAGKGAGKSIGAKGPSGKSKLMTREGDQDQGEYDQEGEMAKNQLHTVLRNAKELHNLLGDNDNLPEWVQSKLAKIEGMMKDVSEYMQSEREQDHEEVTEKAPPGAKAERMVKGIKKSLSKDGNLSDKDKAIAYATTWKAKKTGKVEEESTDTEDNNAKRAGKRVTKDIEHDEGHQGQDDNRAEQAGEEVTKDIEYDDKKDRKQKKDKKKDEVEENTVAGSVAPAMGGKAPKGSGGMMFGKGVYEGAMAESFNNKLKNVLNEGMTINMSADQDGKKSLTVTATDDDADQLAQILKMSGLGGSSDNACSTCGKSGCGCEQMEEDLANSADNTMYADTNYMVNGITGGLDGRKTDQSTLGTVINQDPRRTVGSIAEEIREQQEARLWNLYKQY